MTDRLCGYGSGRDIREVACRCKPCGGVERNRNARRRWVDAVAAVECSNTQRRVQSPRRDHACVIKWLTNVVEATLHKSNPEDRKQREHRANAQRPARLFLWQERSRVRERDRCRK